MAGERTLSDIRRAAWETRRVAYGRKGHSGAYRRCTCDRRDSMDGIEIDTIGGNCPVQAEGRIDGKEFYFRARGDSWTMRIGGEDVVGDPEWFLERDYGDGPYAAGWMTEEEARRFMAAAFALFRTETARPAPSSTET